MIELLLLVLATGPVETPRDTIFQVREGEELILRNLEGDFRVEGWDRPEMRVEAWGEEELFFELGRRDGTLSLRVLDRRGRERELGSGRVRDVELRLTLPKWMKIDVSGRRLDASIRGLEGEVTVSNLSGDLILADLSGEVDASSVEGEITASRLSGSARLRSGDDDLTVRDCTGTLRIETVDGDILLTGMAARAVTVRSTAGDVEFSGRLVEGGEYGFHTHSGDITVRLAPPVNVSATALAYDGDFASDFPVRTSKYESGKSLEFTIGDGGARLIMEAFDGDIRLRELSGR